MAPAESANTTHITVADRDGRIVSATQTINSLFGARYMVPGTGMIPNNYLYVFNPRPGLANSLAPGKRVTSSMSPLIVPACRQTVLCARPARRAADFPLGDAGGDQPDRPWHEPAGSGGGTADLDPGV